MTGVYQHTLDAKGRIFIPARLREELGDTFHITLSLEKCLSAYSQADWEDMMAKIRSMSKIKQMKMRPIFAHAAKVELDAQGRILIPQPLREQVGLKKNVAVVGAGASVEFWDSDTWAQVDASETSPENIMEVFAELDF